MHSPWNCGVSAITEEDSKVGADTLNLSCLNSDILVEIGEWGIGKVVAKVSVLTSGWMALRSLEDIRGVWPMGTATLELPEGCAWQGRGGAVGGLLRNHWEAFLNPSNHPAQTTELDGDVEAGQCWVKGRAGEKKGHPQVCVWGGMCPGSSVPGLLCAVASCALGES